MSEIIIVTIKLLNLPVSSVRRVLRLLTSGEAAQ